MQSYINNLLAVEAEIPSSKYWNSLRAPRNTLRTHRHDFEDDLDEQCGMYGNYGAGNYAGNRASRLRGFDLDEQCDMYGTGNYGGNYGGNRASRVRGGDLGNQWRQTRHAAWDDQDCFDEEDEMVNTRRFGRFGACHDIDDDVVGLRRNWGRGIGAQQQQQQQQGQSRNADVRSKKNIICELVQDREKDTFQNDVIRNLIQNRRNRNRIGCIVQALLVGEHIPKSRLVELLAEDLVLDRVSDNLTLKLCKDDVQNRNTDRIIQSLAQGVPHLSHPGQQQAAARKNAQQQQFIGRVAKTILNPQFAKRVVTSGAACRMLENECDNAHDAVY